MTKVLVHASYFSKNFGDVLLWRIVVDRLMSILGEDSVKYMNMPKDTKNAFLYGLGSVRLLGDDKPDAVVFCGGGYLMPPHTNILKWEVRNFFRHGGALKRAAKAGSVGVFGVGLGEVRFPIFRDLIGKVLKRASPLVLRDNESRSCLSSYGVEASTCMVSPDLALVHVHLNRDDFRSVGKYIGVHADFQGVDEFKKKLFMDACSDLVRRLGMRVRFLVDCESRSSVRSVDEVKVQLGEEIANSCDVVVYRDSCDSFLRSIGECVTVVTTKLHVGICATAMGIPVVSIAKHAKTKRFYSQMGLEWRCAASVGELSALLDDKRLMERVVVAQDLIAAGSVALSLIDRFAERVLHEGAARN